MYAIIFIVFTFFHAYASFFEQRRPKHSLFFKFSSPTPLSRRPRPPLAVRRENRRDGVVLLLRAADE